MFNYKGGNTYGYSSIIRICMGADCADRLEGLLAAITQSYWLWSTFGPCQKKKALFYGLLGAFVFRVIILLLVWLVQWWWVQALGALYLFYVSISPSRT